MSAFVLPNQCPKIPKWICCSHGCFVSINKLSDPIPHFQISLPMAFPKRFFGTPIVQTFRALVPKTNVIIFQVLDDDRFLCAIDDVSLLEQAVAGYFGRSLREVPIESSAIKRFMGPFRSVMSLKVTMTPTV